MYSFDNNTNPQLSAEIMRQIHAIELKKPTMIYTSSHIDKLIEQLNDVLIKHCGIYPYDQKDNKFMAKQYYLYVTSGNEESNKNLIYGTVASFRRITKNKPHILMCDVNDIQLLNYLNQLKMNNDAEIDVLSTNIQGNTITKIIEKSIKPGKTCLLIINCANTVFGSLNNIIKIGELAHQHKIPVHINYNYLFGAAKLNPYENNIDSFIMDFTMLGGIKNFGILGIKKNLLDGYQLDKSVVEFSPILDSTKIDPVSLQMSINTISAIYNGRKTRISKQRRIRTALVKLLKKQFNVVSLVDWLKNAVEFVPGRRSILLLNGSNDQNTVCHNILGFIPLGLTEIEKTKIHEFANYDDIDKAILANYKTIFADLFKKANKDIMVLDNIMILSWGDKMNMTQLTTYVKKIKQILSQ